MAVPKLLDAQCSQCKTAAGNLSVCAGCKVVRYCCKEHQAADWPTHKAQCTPVKKARVHFEKEETELRNFPGDFTCPANPLEEPEPHFWGWLETRPYMRARYGLLDALRKIKTRDAVQAAHDHVKECLRLCRSDNMGVRDMAPALMLRLGRDQEAYDFMKWYATSGEDPDYDWGDLELPYLDLKGENAFEPPTLWAGEFDNFTFKIALTLLKLRLLLDLISLQNSMKIAEKLPQELVDNIRAHLTSDIVANNAEHAESPRRNQHPDAHRCYRHTDEHFVQQR